MKFLDYKMKDYTIILILLLLFNSCSKNPETFLEHINGYWEIESVTLANGVKKEYKVNQTIDYISINDSLEGFRKKMKPLFNDKYEVSNHIESLNIKIENDSLNLYYSTKFTKWKETVLMANTTHLQIVNQNNNVYLYKRYTPITTE